VERRNGVRFGICSVEVVGVDELEEGLIVEELGERVLWVWVGQLITGGLPCAGMVEARESADRVGYGSPGLLDDDLERKKRVCCQIDRLFRKGHEPREINGIQGHGSEVLAENEAQTEDRRMEVGAIDLQNKGCW